MTYLRRISHLGFGALLACGRPAGKRPVAAESASRVPSTDSLVLTNAGGIEVWFTLSRAAAGVGGQRCVERGLEIRNGRSRVQVPLLYTGTSPVLLNDTTMRAVLWTHCQPGEAYLVNLRSGQPVPERQANRP